MDSSKEWRTKANGYKPQPTCRIFASLLAADKNNLEKEIDSIEPFVDGFHIDFMDGLFVSQKYYDINLVKITWLRTRKPIEVHLMMYKPEMCFEELLNEGVERIIVHYEASGIKTINAFEDFAKGTCASLGFAYNPSTKIRHEPMYRAYTQIMSVNPGKCGQKFDKKGLKKIKECVKYEHSVIAVDGGINAKTAKAAFRAGADILVAGSYIFNSKDRIKAIERLR
ncbi:MAG: ribulose-phosphate 3-epimerase [Nanoarchaeota archaeon]